LTSPTLDLAQLARSAGIVRAGNVATSKDFASALNTAFDANGLQVLVLSTEPDVEVVRPPIAFDPVLTKHRFMAAIKAPRYIPTMFGGGKLEADGRES
jgi:thiamine pyrophosphate-dependent acetolactate synthase large subunit-like protein